MDPKRPALAEHPGNKQGSSSRSSGGEQFTNPGGYQGMTPLLVLHIVMHVFYVLLYCNIL